MEAKREKKYSAGDIWKALLHTFGTDAKLTTVCYFLINALRIIFGVMYMFIFDAYAKKDMQLLLFAVVALCGGWILNRILVAIAYQMIGVLASKMKGVLFYSLN